MPTTSRHLLLTLAALVPASAAAFVTLAAQGGSTNALTEPVRVQGGLVSGVAGGEPSITVFKGIPFAAPPVGALRWRAPEQPIAWQGVRAANAFSPSCIQTIVQERKPWTHEFMTHGEISEDCLSVNVWTPARSTAERRPVFVYIYGGANTEGSAAVAVYDGEGLAKKGLVVVTFNYRVGVLGFLSHPELTREAAYSGSGNYGLLDQIAAVRWVHENIAAFGGDPERVTVAGQSAGAQGVHNLTASPLAKGLFHRAIAQSGSSLAAFRAGRAMADGERDGVRFAEAKGAGTLADLRAMPWQDVVAPVTGPAFRFGVVIDGYALPSTVAQAFAAGRQNDVPTLTGLNADENGASPNPSVTLESFRAQARQRFGDQADLFLELYPATTDEEAKAAQNDSARDQARMSMYLWAVERAHSSKTSVYTYFWAHPLPGPDVGRYGAFHTSEVPYVLNTLNMTDRPVTDVDRTVADTLSSYWANFATTGNPNGPGLPHWPDLRERAGGTMELDATPRLIPVTGNNAMLVFFEHVLAP